MDLRSNQSNIFTGFVLGFFFGPDSLIWFRFAKITNPSIFWVSWAGRLIWSEITTIKKNHKIMKRKKKGEINYKKYRGRKTVHIFVI